ncbi:MAG: hypothetical protein ACREE2_11895 [Stellaceae bacterium]
MKMQREKLERLQHRLVQERGRILAEQGGLAVTGRLPAQLLRELADLDIAARAVAAEITRHSPRLGYGSEA